MSKGYIIITHFRMYFTDHWGVWTHIRFFKKYYVKRETAEDAIKQSIHAQNSLSFEYKHEIVEFEYQINYPPPPH
jgi:hypothetical protein